MQILHVIRCAQCGRLAPSHDAEVVRLMEPESSLGSHSPELVPTGDLFVCAVCAREIRTSSLPEGGPGGR